MRLVPVVWVLAVFVGCGHSDPFADTAASAEDTNSMSVDESLPAMRASQDVLTVFGALADASDGADRRDNGGERKGDVGCPAYTYTLTSITIDYGTGCVPASGWTSSTVAGSIVVDVVRVERALTFSFNGYSVDSKTVDGTLTGYYTRRGTIQRPGPLYVELEADLTSVTPEGTVEFVATLEVLYDRSGPVTINGSVAYTNLEGSTLTLTAADIELTRVEGAACPLPSDGTLTVDRDGTVTVLAFDEDSPSTGTVSVTASGPTIPFDICTISGALSS